MSRDPKPTQLQPNRLLAALPADTILRLEPQLVMVDLPLGKVLHEAGEAIRHVYFPLDGVISLVQVLESGDSADIAVVGHEGLVGVPVVLGAASGSSRALVQGAGQALRLPAPRLLEAFHADEVLRRVVLRYVQALLIQVSQTVVCNRHHTIDQQLCRWLLLSLDRLPGNRLAMTQELIANMLGVRREGVTDAARKLQGLGVIEYSRGNITLLDRPQLERLSCECYAVVRAETERLMRALGTPGTP